MSGKRWYVMWVLWVIACYLIWSDRTGTGQTQIMLAVIMFGVVAGMALDAVLKAIKSK